MKKSFLLFLLCIGLCSTLRGLDLDSDDWWAVENTESGILAMRIDDKILLVGNLSEKHIERRQIEIKTRTSSRIEGNLGKTGGGFVIRKMTNGRAKYEETNAPESALMLRDSTPAETRSCLKLESWENSTKSVCKRTANCGMFAYGLLGATFNFKKELGTSPSRSRCESKLGGFRAIIESRDMDLPSDCL